MLLVNWGDPWAVLLPELQSLCLEFVLCSFFCISFNCSFSFLFTLGENIAVEAN